MARIAPNADIYAADRLGIFFTAHNQTNADGNLTGQCVTLVKWFMAEMTSVPSPFAARGDAKDVGRNLVAQGHAVEVPWDQRRRGDIICYEYGIYGHIASQLSGGRVFESNVNIGVAQRLVDGTYVYASRIGSENEAWRAGKNPHVYRLKTYSEEGDIDMATDAQKTAWINYEHETVFGKPAPQEVIDSWRGILNKDFVQGSLDIMASNNKNPAALKNRPASGNAPAGTYLKVNKSDIIDVK